MGLVVFGRAVRRREGAGIGSSKDQMQQQEAERRTESRRKTERETKEKRERPFNILLQSL